MTGKKSSAKKFEPPARAVTDGAAGEPQPLTDFRTMTKGSSYLRGSNLFRLCRELDEMEYLPALVFNFNRTEIQRMLVKLVTELKDQQYQKYLPALVFNF